MSKNGSAVFASTSDVAALGAGSLGATWLGLGNLDSVLAVGVAALTILLLLVRIGLAIREWRRS